MELLNQKLPRVFFLKTKMYKIKTIDIKGIHEWNSMRKRGEYT